MKRRNKERIFDLPKATQLVTKKAKIQAKSIYSSLSKPGLLSLVLHGLAIISSTGELAGNREATES